MAIKIPGILGYRTLSLGVFWSVFILFLSCKTNTVVKETAKPKAAPSSSILPKDFVESLREDAAYILINEIKFGHEGPVEFADLPPSLLDKYQRILIRVHEFAILNKEVPSLREAHEFHSIDLKKIQVVLNNDCSFLENWINGLSTTNNLYLNKIMTQYQIQVTNYQKNILGHSFLLVSPDFINTQQFSIGLSGIEGIKIAEPISATGDGHHINFVRVDKVLNISFRIGYGDCYSGCINRCSINFEMAGEKDIKYTGMSGDPLPENWGN